MIPSSPSQRIKNLNNCSFKRVDKAAGCVAQQRCHGGREWAIVAWGTRNISEGFGCIF